MKSYFFQYEGSYRKRNYKLITNHNKPETNKNGQTERVWKQAQNNKKGSGPFQTAPLSLYAFLGLLTA
jgi:hypothetical protein